jgi:hypothetical protein
MMLMTMLLGFTHVLEVAYTELQRCTFRLRWG